MMILNKQIISTAVQEYKEYDTILLSFYSVLHSVKINTSHRLTSLFPEAMKIKTSAEWFVPLEPLGIFVVAKIDFHNAIIIIKSISTNDFRRSS